MKAKLKPHKLLSMLLALVMAVGMLPGMGMTALAAMMAGGSDSFGTVRLTFTEDSVFSDQVIKLKVSRSAKSVPRCMTFPNLRPKISKPTVNMLRTCTATTCI